MNPLADHMKLFYQVYYFPSRKWRGYLVTRAQPHMDVRHIVRTRLGEIHGAGPAEVARAEALLSGRPSVNHATIINSRGITNQVLAPQRPLLVKRIDRLIRQTTPS